jgi:hypothetical protein
MQNLKDYVSAQVVADQAAAAIAEFNKGVADAQAKAATAAALIAAVNSLPGGDKCQKLTKEVGWDAKPVRDVFANAKQCATENADSVLAKQKIADTYSTLAGDARTQSDLATAASATVPDDRQKAKNQAAQAADNAKQNAAVALAKLTSVQKRDAISVYGSFNSDTNAQAGSPSAGSATTPPTSGSSSATTSSGIHLAIGKVFSTGVAAQNLSEAQKSVADAASYAACIQSVAGVVVALEPDASASGAADRRKTLAEDLFKKCEGAAPVQKSAEVSK